MGKITEKTSNVKAIFEENLPEQIKQNNSVQCLINEMDNTKITEANFEVAHSILSLDIIKAYKFVRFKIICKLIQLNPQCDTFILISLNQKLHAQTVLYQRMSMTNG